MTQTVERRPLNPPAPPRRTAAGVLLPGIVAASWAAGAGLVAVAVPVLLTWATDSRSGSPGAAATRAAAQIWLLAQGTPLTIPGGSVGLTPLGLLLLPLLLLHRAGRHAARTAGHAAGDAAGDAPGDAAVRATGLLTLAIAAPYALVVAVVAGLSTTKQIHPDPVRALLGGLAVALVGAGTGVAREAGLLRRRRDLPGRVRRLAAGAAASVGVLFAGGALLAGVSLAAHGSRATALASASGPGLFGGLALLVLGLLFIPNAAVWGLSWLTGPGFAVGVGTTVSPFATTLGGVPAFPLLAALPGGDTPVWIGVLLLAVPLCAGLFGGLLVARPLVTTWSRAALEGAALGPVVGLVVAGLAGISGGPLGSHQLAAVGPSPWKVGLAVMVEISVSAAIACALSARRPS